MDPDAGSESSANRSRTSQVTDDILAGTGIGTVILDPDLRLLRFTPAIQDRFDVKTSDIGRHLAHVTAVFPLSDGDRLLGAATSALETGAATDVVILVAEDRTELVKLAPVRNEDDGIDGLVMTFVDVTELKQVQDRQAHQNHVLEEVLEGAMAGYWDYQPATGAFFMSPSFKGMLGFAGDQIGNTLDEMRHLVHADDLERVDAELDRLVARSTARPPPPPPPDSGGDSCGDLYEMETRFHHRDGSTVWVWCRGRLLTGADGTSRIIGCYVDISALKEIEADLLRSNDELKQFAYLTSHDLQEPLRTVSNFVEVLERRYGDRLDDDGQQYLTIVMQATVRMQRLIRGILDYSRIGRSGVREMVDLELLLESVVNDLDSAIDEAGAVLNLEPLPKVVGYESELRMLFANLVSNAIKFRKPTVTPEIRVEAKRLPSGDWRFTVADNGIGIPAEQQERIFEIFNRLHTRDEFEGAGIGLAHARKIVELHGGRLWVHSEPGVGSAFSFDLRLG